MPSPEQVHSDLRYVREALESSRSRPTPPSIYLLWALISALGFPLIDLAPGAVGLFWLIAAPSGLVLSLALGRRQGRRLGQVERGEATRHGLHWIGLLLAIGLATPLSLTGRVDGSTFAQLILLLVALAYFLAGVHLDRLLLWVSALLAASFLALFVLAAWGWTVVGLTIATSLGLCALLARAPAQGERAA
jgi:hypothetical protein